MKEYNHFYAGFFAVIGAVVGGITFYILAMGLGVITGVVAMCATAPIWWIVIFSLAFLFGIFASVFYAAHWAYWRYRKVCDVKNT